MDVMIPHDDRINFESASCETWNRTCRYGSDGLSVNAFLIALVFGGRALLAPHLASYPQWEVVTGSYDLHYYFNPKTYKMQWSQPAGAVICKVNGQDTAMQPRPLTLPLSFA